MRKPSVLIIEDNPDIAYVFQVALEEIGFEVEIIDNGARALARLTEKQPSLVVLDINLPLVQGENILRQFSTDMNLLNTRVMVVTANAKKARELQGKADLVAVKPVSYTELRDMALSLIPSPYLKRDGLSDFKDPSDRA